MRNPHPVRSDAIRYGSSNLLARTASSARRSSSLRARSSYRPRSASSERISEQLESAYSPSCAAIMLARVSSTKENSHAVGPPRESAALSNLGSGGDEKSSSRYCPISADSLTAVDGGSQLRRMSRRKLK